MKIIRIVSVLSISWLLMTGVCTAMEVRKAIVYDDQAILSFDRHIKGTLSIEAPPDMVPESLVVTPQAGGLVRSVSMEPMRSPSGKVKALQDELADRQASLAAAKRDQAMVDRQIEIVFLAAGSKEKPAPFSRQQLADALSFIDDRIPALNRRAAALTQKIADLTTEIGDLQNRLGEVNRDPGRLIRILGDGPVGISYVVRSASWRPEYRVDASPLSSQLAVEVAASIRQSTGMDWDIGELQVSTGRPSFGIQAPELRPWYLERPSLRVMKSMPESFDAAAMQAGAPMEESRAQVEATTTSYLIGAARNVHLAGDGTPETVRLGRQNPTASFTLVSVPRYSTGAYLRAEAILTGDAPVIPGSYSSFVDGIFSGKGTLGRTEPGQKCTVDLGVDEGILVKRKETRAFHEKTITGKDRTTYTYEITVENTRKRTASIIVKDQIPLSRDEEIEVKLTKTDPEVKPDQDGVLSWSIDLGPREKKLVSFSFSITGAMPMPYR
ncbi:MAG: DUF4139 domain-containing protein [Desulfobacterota bacterium]|nr:DUF4139 domain-containing protein [Thermodesulfobacteriota bacterium]